MRRNLKLNRRVAPSSGWQASNVLQKMNIACVIFDLDGTLVDSEGLCNQAFLDLLPELNCSLEHMVTRYRGQKLAPILADIEQRLALKLPSGFEQNYRARVAELFDTELLPMPGVSEMLSSVGYPICAASSGPLEKINKALSVSSLSHFFGDNVFSSYEVGSWKPDPGLFLHAAKAMGYPPESCAVIEDSQPGIQAAISAGMQSFLYSPEGSIISDHNAVVFKSMRELPHLLGCAQPDHAEQDTAGQSATVE